MIEIEEADPAVSVDKACRLLVEFAELQPSLKSKSKQRRHRRTIVFGKQPKSRLSVRFSGEAIGEQGFLMPDAVVEIPASWLMGLLIEED